jgi:hypothetical protein
MHGSYQMVNTIRIGSSGQVREDQKHGLRNKIAMLRYLYNK